MTPRIVVYRILGNDLPPRHGRNQTVLNLEFLTRYEDPLEGAERRFLLNRIFDPAKRDRLVELLGAEGFGWEEIPFRRSEYDALRSDDERFAYLTNVNAARNTALANGFGERGADYVLPLDGGCFFRRDGWAPIVDLLRQETQPFVVVPMWRCDDNSLVIGNAAPELEETFDNPRGAVRGMTEPQLGFWKGVPERFLESLPYGKVSKVELLWRLGVPGPWDCWEPGIRKRAVQQRSKFAGRCRPTGYVCRLSARNAAGSTTNRGRAAMRQDARAVLFRSVAHSA